MAQSKYDFRAEALSLEGETLYFKGNYQVKGGGELWQQRTLSRSYHHCRQLASGQVNKGVWRVAELAVASLLVHQAAVLALESSADGLLAKLEHK